MKRLLHRLRDVVRLAREGHARDVLGFMRSRLRSEYVSYGLRRDLRRPLTPPPAKIELQVRPLAPDDSLSFLDATPGATSDADLIRRNQLLLLASGIPTCFIATDPDGKPCYMQWLITSRDNARIKRQWGGVIPQLGPQEALLEGAYTPDSHRGLGIMAAAMARIAEKATERGASSVITFVAEDNVASLKGCKKAGFDPYVERRVTWRLGRRRAVFTLLPDGFRFPYEHEAKEVNQPGDRRDLLRSAPIAAAAQRSAETQSPPV
jgi:GNAT superfamily N-acetyltransferase